MDEARSFNIEPDTSRNGQSGEQWKQVLLLGERLLLIPQQFNQQEITSFLDTAIGEMEHLINLYAKDILNASSFLVVSTDYFLNNYPRGMLKSDEVISHQGNHRFFSSVHPPGRELVEPLKSLIQKAYETHQISYASRLQSLSSKQTRWDIRLGKPTGEDVRNFVVPLLLDNEDISKEAILIGLISLERGAGEPFTENEEVLFDGLVIQLRNALVNLRGKFVEGRRIEQYSALLEVSNVISSVLEQDKLLDQVVELIQKRFGYPYVHLFSVHPGRRMIFYEAGSGARSKMMHQARFSIDLDDRPGIIPWVGRRGETVLSNDVSQDYRYRPEPFPPKETRSELTVPLIFGEKILGILDLQSDRLNAFTEQDRFLIEALADMIAVALRNASLYRSEQWRRQVADSLREVAGLLSADVSVDQVLHTILVELERNLPTDLATIWLLDEDQSEVEQERGSIPLQLAAVYGVGEPVTDLRIGMRLEEIGESQWTSNGLQEILSPAWFSEVLDSEKPLIYRPRLGQASPEDDIASGGDISAIAARLRVGRQNLGVLTLFHHTAGRYGSEAKAMTEAFASYAAVAIENARLFEVAHEQAWISTVMLQVAEATRTITDLKDLLETVANITPTVAGVRTCMLYLLDDKRNFIPAVASGLNQIQYQRFEQLIFSADEIPALYNLLENKIPVVLDDENEDCRMSGILFVGLETNNLLVDELYILVPMLSHDDVLGAMLISYSIDIFDRDNQQTLNKFFEQKLPILQGIAHQTAVSIENTRLIRAQKEEAYVSVALLQVAQVIVSMTDLEDVLASIVRITPILAGVKRSVIYLYDAKNGIYQMTQSYGLPREVDSHQFVIQEFPLLDAVRKHEQLIALPAIRGWDETEDIHDAWIDMPLPTPDKVELLLKNDDPLILAFPLSVQDELLGILLVEEPEPVHIDVLMGESSYRRLREKRMEIITGISQQASLAIKNAYLQREMVDRERLNRELQLAYEIQRSFLPRDLPNYPGWDVSLFWQPAREVGGDFYDYFNLPDKRIGLVIADVADKGMPAALYMTLVRTLIRGFIGDIDSPARVLERVNDVLVDNSQRGMFVTVFYAVFSLESGKFIYANAGHVPPYLLRGRRDEEAELLRRTSMALGVMERTIIEEKTVYLEPKDFLILYTDGITEAVDDREELFGMDRLSEVITHTIISGTDESRNMADLTATEVVEAINGAVNAFVGDIPQADDLTLLVIKRTGKV